MKAVIEFGIATHVGMVRTENQDCYGEFPVNRRDIEDEGGKLFIVADGMGGHRAGRLASEIAVRTIAASYYETNGSSITERLQTAFQTANSVIYTHGVLHPEHAGLGTTCVALVLKDQGATIAHIGDSRVYRINKHGIWQLTQDHTKVAEMQRRGIITADEALTHPEKHHLYRALGVREGTEVDIISDISCMTREYFLLCTDGLYEYVTDAEMKKLVLSHPPQEACDRMILHANERGGHDNSTVCVARAHYTGSFLGRIKSWEH